MKKNFLTRKFISLLALAFLCFARIFAFELAAIKTERADVSIYRGKEMQKASLPHFDVSLFSSRTSGTLEFSASITNKSDKDFFFEEGAVSIWQGVYEKGEWKLASYIPASVYLKAAKAAAEEEETLQALSLGLSIANSGFSTVTETTFVNGYGYTYTRNVYNPVEAAWEIALSYDELSRLKRNNKEYLAFLEKTLLFSSTVKAGESYSGFFTADVSRGPDYKVVFDFSEDERAEFYFTRSDKDEILHPWKDKTRDRHSLSFGLSPLDFKHYSFYYLWSRPRGVGMYSSFYFQKEGKYLSNNMKKYDAFAFATGLTIKTFPYTWLLIGCGVEIADLVPYENLNTRKYYGASWTNHKDIDFFFAPQVGINFIANFLNVGAVAYFPIGGKITFDIMMGFSF